MPIKAAPRCAPALATPTNLRRLTKLGEATTSAALEAGAPSKRAASGPTTAAPAAVGAPALDGAIDEFEEGAELVACKACITQAEALQPKANQTPKVTKGMPHCTGAQRVDQGRMCRMKPLSCNGTRPRPGLA